MIPGPLFHGRGNTGSHADHHGGQIHHVRRPLWSQQAGNCTRYCLVGEATTAGVRAAACFRFACRHRMARCTVCEAFDNEFSANRSLIVKRSCSSVGAFLAATAGSLVTALGARGQPSQSTPRRPQHSTRLRAATPMFRPFHGGFTLRFVWCRLLLRSCSAWPLEAAHPCSILSRSRGQSGERPLKPLHCITTMTACIWQKFDAKQIQHVLLSTREGLPDALSDGFCQRCVLRRSQVWWSLVSS